ncbi:MAG: DPP IV N-terminal domain-containing protein, partial [Chloroflexota bacterium]|nr:DPP IV N-terminal domain-containing protein [Chloroflexota bacterium]
MNLALPRRIVAAAIVFAVLIGGCSVNVSQTPDPARPQQTQQPAVPPTPDKIEKAQSRVTLDGRVLVVKDGNIWLLTQDAFKQISSGGKSRQPAWSPDGRQVSFVKNNGGSSDLWVMNADGSVAHAITQFGGGGGKSGHWAFQPA